MSKGRLLIIEDDAAFRETLRLEFTERGYEVLGVGRECAEMVAFAPQFAIVDLRLEHESGMGLVRRLRQEVTQCRIVILTGYGSIATAVEAIKLGCIEYLTKPVDMDILEVKLAGQNFPPEESLFTRPSLARHERDYIEFVIQECDGNISQAARELGIHRQSLQRKLRKYPPKN